MRTLFLYKKGDAHSERALTFARANFDATTLSGNWGDPFPEEHLWWEGDLIVSYLSRWIVPASLLNRARLAINFHPGPPEYPGIGCNNFALYDGATTYGATCHLMAPKVDEGRVVSVVRFPVFESDDVASLLGRTYDHMLTLFYEVVGRLAAGQGLPTSDETWRRKPYTRKELDELSRITTDMDAEEIRRRERATAFGSWRPFVEVAGRRFELKPE